MGEEVLRLRALTLGSSPPPAVWARSGVTQGSTKSLRRSLHRSPPHSIVRKCGRRCSVCGLRA